MSTKLMLFFAGIIGSVVSLSGVSTSSHRSAKPATKDPIHKWKTEIPNEIMTEFDCRELRFGEGGVEIETETAVKLGLVWTLKKSSFDDLESGKKLETEGKVRVLEQNGKTALWPVKFGEKKSKVTVTVPSDRKKLKVELSTESESRGESVRTSWDDRSFSCNWESLANQNTKGRLYYEEGELKNGQWVTKTTENKLKANISLNKENCKLKKDEQTIICDLEIVTGNNLSWKAKVQAQAKFSIS